MTRAAVFVMAVSLIGFVPVLALNAFVFDDFDAYGEVPVPGTSSIELPQGEVNVSFHTLVIGGGNGGLPIPQMSIGIVPPDGVPDPVLTEDVGTTTSVNNDSRVRVWVAEIPAEGTYGITTDGTVSAYVNPTLAFGHASDYGGLPLVFGAIAGLGLLDLVIARIWAARVRRTDVPVGLAPSVESSFVPTDQGVRLQELTTLARLRDSGALTDAEFEAEKKRVLDGR